MFKKIRDSGSLTNNDKNKLDLEISSISKNVFVETNFVDLLNYFSESESMEFLDIVIVSCNVNPYLIVLFFDAVPSEL